MNRIFGIESKMFARRYRRRGLAAVHSNIGLPVRGALLQPRGRGKETLRGGLNRQKTRFTKPNPSPPLRA
jgi:hypothetical protein